MDPATQHNSDDEDEEQAIPITSLPCQWKQPRKRKEATLQVASVDFAKHNFEGRKRKRASMIEFDPRQHDFRGTAQQSLCKFLVRDDSPCLGVSVLLNDKLAKQQQQLSDEEMLKHVDHLISTLKMSPYNSLRLPQDLKELRTTGTKQEDYDSLHPTLGKLYTTQNLTQ